MKCVVTGASRGIGHATASLLLQRGHHVALVARNTEPLLALAANHGERAMALATDLSDAAAVASVIAPVAQAWGALDVLIHCAGTAEHRPLHEVAADQIDRMLAIHVRAPLLLARDFVKASKPRQPSEPLPVIVLVSSTLAMRGVAATSAYAAAKGAVTALTRSLAAELAPTIRVVCVSPGGVDTDMVADRRVSLAAEHPLGRLATSEEVAGAIAFLLDAQFVTGSVLTIDGGWVSCEPATAL